MRQASIYILPDSEGVELSPNNYNVLMNAVQDDTTDSPASFICCDTAVAEEKFLTLPEFVMSLCRNNNLLKNERMTLLSSMDQMVAVQLCLAEKNREDYGDYDVESSTVIHQTNLLIKKKLLHCAPDTEMTQTIEDGLEQAYTQYLSNCNQVDMCDILHLLKSGCEKNEQLKNELSSTDLIILGLPSHQIQKCMLKFLCTAKEVKKVTMETALENSSDVSVFTVPSTLEEIQQHNIPNFSTSKTMSITESYVRMILLSYLELIVNTRSELALARALNVPNRDLTHEAFTEVKREAKKKNMTMYQTASSYIMKIRLGGKGYAPDPNHPLLQFVKGLGEFLDLMQKLQDVIEEENNTRIACRKVVNIIKKELLKANDTKLRQSSIESISDRLQGQITLVVNQMEKNTMTSPDKSVSNGGSMLGRKTLRSLRHITDKLLTQQDQTHSLDYLCDGFSSQKTPIRFPSILSQFRSPDEEVDEEHPELSLSLSERLIKRNSGVSMDTSKSYKSSYDWAMPAHHVGLPNKDDISLTQSEIVVLPSKTLAHPASASKSGMAKKILESLKDQENLQTSKQIKSVDFISKPCKSTEVISSQSSSDHSSQQSVETSNNSCVNVVKEGKKRKITEAKEPAKKKAKTDSKSCRRKLLPQVKGQQQLSKFFRV